MKKYEPIKPVAWTAKHLLESVAAGNEESIWPKNYQHHQFPWSPDHVPLYACQPSETDSQWKSVCDVLIEALADERERAIELTERLSAFSQSHTYKD